MCARDFKSTGKAVCIDDGGGGGAGAKPFDCGCEREMSRYLDYKWYWSPGRLMKQHFKAFRIHSSLH